MRSQNSMDAASFRSKSNHLNFSSFIEPQHSMSTYPPPFYVSRGSLPAQSKDVANSRTLLSDLKPLPSAIELIPLPPLPFGSFPIVPASHPILSSGDPHFLLPRKPRKSFPSSPSLHVQAASMNMISTAASKDVSPVAGFPSADNLERNAHSSAASLSWSANSPSTNTVTTAGSPEPSPADSAGSNYAIHVPLSSFVQLFANRPEFSFSSSEGFEGEKRPTSSSGPHSSHRRHRSGTENPEVPRPPVAQNSLDSLPASKTDSETSMISFRKVADSMPDLKHLIRADITTIPASRQSQSGNHSRRVKSKKQVTDNGVFRAHIDSANNHPTEAEAAGNTLYHSDNFQGHFDPQLRSMPDVINSDLPNSPAFDPPLAFVPSPLSQLTSWPTAQHSTQKAALPGQKHRKKRREGHVSANKSGLNNALLVRNARQVTPPYESFSKNTISPSSLVRATQPLDFRPPTPPLPVPSNMLPHLLGSDKIGNSFAGTRHTFSPENDALQQELKSSPILHTAEQISQPRPVPDGFVQFSVQKSKTKGGKVKSSKHKHQHITDSRHNNNKKAAMLRTQLTQVSPILPCSEVNPGSPEPPMLEIADDNNTGHFARGHHGIEREGSGSRRSTGHASCPTISSADQPGSSLFAGILERNRNIRKAELNEMGHRNSEISKVGKTKFPKANWNQYVDTDFLAYSTRGESRSTDGPPSLLFGSELEANVINDTASLDESCLWADNCGSGNTRLTSVPDVHLSHNPSDLQDDSYGNVTYADKVVSVPGEMTSTWVLNVKGIENVTASPFAGPAFFRAVQRANPAGYEGSKGGHASHGVDSFSDNNVRDKSVKSRDLYRSLKAAESPPSPLLSSRPHSFPNERKVVVEREHRNGRSFASMRENQKLKEKFHRLSSIEKKSIMDREAQDSITVHVIVRKLAVPLRSVLKNSSSSRFVPRKYKIHVQFEPFVKVLDFNPHSRPSMLGLD